MPSLVETGEGNATNFANERRCGAFGASRCSRSTGPQPVGKDFVGRIFGGRNFRRILCGFSACSVSHCSDNKIQLRATGALKRQVDECWLQMPGRRRASKTKCYHELMIRQAGAPVALGRASPGRASLGQAATTGSFCSLSSAPLRRRRRHLLNVELERSDVANNGNALLKRPWITVARSYRYRANPATLPLDVWRRSIPSLDPS
jgi:hypothetical protein